MGLLPLTDAPSVNEEEEAEEEEEPEEELRSFFTDTDDGSSKRDSAEFGELATADTDMRGELTVVATSPADLPLPEPTRDASRRA